MDLQELSFSEMASNDNELSENPMRQNALILRDVVKTYPPSVLGGAPKHAVRGVSLACPLGERFGLLGINGAGKTTILSILTGE